MKKREYCDIYCVVAKNIKRYRKMLGISQLQLSTMTGISFEYIRRIEAPNIRKTFSIETVDIIARALNIETYLLFKRNNKD
jgi:transcriptional regulator with XRE-family HTH domain